MSYSSKGDKMYKSVSMGRHKFLDPTVQSDPTRDNWLRLAAAILIKPENMIGCGRNNSTLGISLTDLYDKEEELKRMKEIDELRARGEKTEYEKLHPSDSERYKSIQKSYSRRGAPIEVTNLSTGEVKKFESIKSASYECNLLDYNIVNRFKKADTNEIVYSGYKFKKINIEKVEFNLKAYRQYYDASLHTKHKTKIAEWEKAFVAQHRPMLKWKEISLILGRTPESCGNILRDIKKKGKLEYYKSLDITEVEIGA